MDQNSESEQPRQNVSPEQTISPAEKQGNPYSQTEQDARHVTGFVERGLPNEITRENFPQLPERFVSNQRTRAYNTLLSHTVGLYNDTDDPELKALLKKDALRLEQERDAKAKEDVIARIGNVSEDEIAAEKEKLDSTPKDDVEHPNSLPSSEIGFQPPVPRTAED